MATQGAVGVLVNREPLRWIGVYNHWDSYPKVLLRALIEEVLPECGYDGMKVVERLIVEHPGGWSHIYRGGVILPDPDKPDGFLYKEDADVPQCYCHSEYFLKRDGFSSGLVWGCDCQDGIDGPGKSTCWELEWIYLFDVGKGTILVLASRAYGESRYRHEVVAEVPIKGAGEIDYDALERRRW
jgi:hypothetical protein